MPRAPPPRCWAVDCSNPAPAAKCGRCHTAAYCSAPCQRAHWPAHRPHCKELEAAAAAAKARDSSPFAGGNGECPPEAQRTPGVYSGLECRVEDFHCALDSCGAVLDKMTPTNVLCNGCRCVAYCNEACQLAHWAGHKEACYYAVCKRVCSGDVHQDDEGGEYVLRTGCACAEKRMGPWMGARWSAWTYWAG
jgi:hypothetical protein